MSTNLRKLIIRMSRLAMYATAVCMSLTMVFAAESIGQRKLLKDIPIEFTLTKTMSLQSLIDEVESSGKFTFVYSKKDIRGITLAFDQPVGSMEDLLNEISIQARVSIKRVNETISFKNVVQNAAMPQVFEEVPVQVSVSGKVTDETGESLIGAAVLEKGTSNGTITDIDGSYQLTVGDGAVLLVSFVGYQSIEIPVNNRTSINPQLQLDTEQLDEIVVIGYGTQVRREITGAVSSLNEKTFSPSVNASVEQMIEGKMPGVQVVQNSGEPGGGISVNIRGVGSINAGSEPLYVIDGLPIDNSVLIGGTGNQVASTRSPRNPISFLNPADIESIEVLKDASASAIYGARGANGVILITTKSGQSGALKVDYSGHTGINRVHNRLDLLGPEEYMEGINDLIAAGGGDPSEVVTEIQNGGTDWQEVVFRDAAKLQKHNLSFSWGNKNTSYMVSANYTDEEGMVRNTSFTRYGARFNLSHTDEKFRFGSSMTTSYVKDVFVPNGFDVNLRAGAINAAKLWDPTFDVRDANGNFVTTDLFDIDNPEAIITGNHMDGNRYRYLGTMFGEYFITPAFSAKIRVGADVANEDKTVYKDRTTIIGNSLGGVATAYQAMQSNYLFEGTMNFQESFDIHTIEVLAGVTTQEYTNRSSSQQANNFPTDATLADNFGLADRTTLVNSSGKSKNSLLSYLGRVNYKLLDRYLFTASFRADGSSRFGPGNKYGYFPSFSVGWLINEESFFPSADNLFEMLKLRASWGQTGNQEIGNNQYLTTFTGGASRTSYVLNDQFVTTFNPSRIANPDLKWETTEQLDFGLDFSIKGGRVSGTIEWYRKNTFDMLLSLPVPSSSGYSSKLVNIGSMYNSGFEFGLNTNNITTNDFNWNTDLNFYTLKNEVEDLGGIEQILTGNFSVAAGSISIIEPGLTLRSFYGYEVEGIWQESDDLNAITNNVSPGDFKFRDVNEDGTIDGDDRVVLGNSFPDFTWGLGNTLTYKGFSLHVFLRGVQGVEMINGNLLEQYFPRSGVRINRFREPFNNRWTPSNPTNDQPSYLNAASQLSQAVNSRTVVDASYVKLQTVRISYVLPQPFLSQVFNSVEVYATGLNLMTFSDYDGFDPALNPNGSANFRIDWNGYPSATTFLLGLNLGF